MNLRNINYQYLEPKVFQSMRKLYLNDNKDIITDELLTHFQQGDPTDFVKLKDVKTVLQNAHFKEKDVITIIKLVDETFENVEFKQRYNNIRNIFTGLKYA